MRRTNRGLARAGRVSSCASDQEEGFSGPATTESAIRLAQQFHPFQLQVLESIGADVRAALGAHASLEEALGRLHPISVALFGEAQVGKSSLVNAMLGETVLPAGGVGPLTAQATRIAWGAQAGYAVKFRTSDWLIARVEAIERADAQSPREQRRMRFLLGEDGPSGVADEDFRSEEVRAALSLAAGRPAGRRIPPRLEARAEAIRELLGRTIIVERLEGPTGLDAGVRAVCAEWRSAIVEELVIRHPHELLRRVELVDLPGIGVRSDSAAELAEEWIRGGCDVVIVVTRNEGLKSGVAEALARTGVLQGLMDIDHRQRVGVEVVVTHLDDVARSRWQSTRCAREQSSTGLAVSRQEVFRGLEDEMRLMVQRQFCALLETLVASSSTDCGGAPSGMTTGVARAAAAKVGVSCVASLEHAQLLAGLGEESFLKDIEATNVGVMAGRLETLADNFQEVPLRDVREAENRLRQELADAHLAVIRGAGGTWTGELAWRRRPEDG